MAEPRVTVAIPTWNRAELLREALVSVLEQTFADLEVVVADNGSTDGTADVVRELDDGRVRHLPVPENIGFVPNLNRCLERGTAPYVTVLHDDDLMRPTNIERKVAVLDADPRVGIAYSNYATVGPEGELLQARTPIDAAAHETGDAFIARSLAGYGRVHMSAALLRRSALGSRRFEEGDRNYLDLGLWLRIALDADVAYLDEPLCEIRMHGGSASAASAMYAADALLVTDTVEQLALVQHAKSRFLRTFGDELPEAPALRRASRAFLARQLALVVDRDTRPERRLGEVARLTLAASRVEPMVLLQRRLGRVVAGGLGGRPARHLVRRVREVPAP